MAFPKIGIFLPNVGEYKPIFENLAKPDYKFASLHYQQGQKMKRLTNIKIKLKNIISVEMNCGSKLECEMIKTKKPDLKRPGLNIQFEYKSDVY